MMMPSVLPAVEHTKIDNFLHSLVTTQYDTINMDTVFKASKANTDRIITVINTNTQQIIDNTNTKNYMMDLANELRGKMSRLCGGDACVEWVSVTGEDEWYKIHGRLIDTNVKLNNSISEKELFVNQEVEKIHEDRRVNSPSITQDTNARRQVWFFRFFCCCWCCPFFRGKEEEEPLHPM